MESSSLWVLRLGVGGRLGNGYLDFKLLVLFDFLKLYACITLQK